MQLTSLSFIFFQTITWLSGYSLITALEVNEKQRKPIKQTKNSIRGKSKRGGKLPNLERGKTKKSGKLKTNDKHGGKSSREVEICLHQADFDQGTKIITQPGIYKLCENIVFHPKSDRSGILDQFDPSFPGPYDENAFSLGFFAAVCLATSNVEIHLNGYSIEQSRDHALMQRFFAVFELSSAPFIQGAGPADFVGSDKYLYAASGVKIIGPGKIGRSSHHGIHGNDNKNIEIKNVVFEDFEVAALSLNNVDNLIVQDCVITRNRHDVPVLGMFSAARFISPYGKKLKDIGYKMDLKGVETTAAEVYDKLIHSIYKVYNDVKSSGTINKDLHRYEYELFHNEFGVVEGPCYAFLVHGKGPAVGDFGFELDDDNDITSSNVVIENNLIENIKCWVNEVPAIIENGAIMNDARGAVFQIIRSTDNKLLAMNKDGTYKGNVVANMQIMVAKAIHDGVLQNFPGLQTAVNSIDQTIIGWAASSSSTYWPSYRCNGDSMHHVSKGITVIRIEDTVGFEIQGNIISNITNLSVIPFDQCTDYHKNVNIGDAEDKEKQEGPNIRGISIAAVNGYSSEMSSKIYNNGINKFFSENANIIVGIDIQGECDSISILHNEVDLRSGVGRNANDVYVALRLWKDVTILRIDDIKLHRNNHFIQEILEMNAPRKLQSCPVSGKNSEWKVGHAPGACPFGFKNNLKIVT